MKGFIVELIKRWGAKQPWFFKAVQWASIALAFILGLPDVLQEAGLIDELPFLQPIVDQVVLYAGLAAAFVAKLAATSDAKKERNIVD